MLFLQLQLLELPCPLVNPCIYYTTNMRQLFFSVLGGTLILIYSTSNCFQDTLCNIASILSNFLWQQYAHAVGNTLGLFPFSFMVLQTECLFIACKAPTFRWTPAYHPCTRKQKHEV